MPAFVVVEADNEGFKVYDSSGTLIDPAKDATVAAITTALNLIKNTDGIKKIVDPLPAGTNEIGKVAQGTKAAGSGAWPQVLYDAAGNPIAVKDGSTVTLATQSGVLVGGVNGSVAKWLQIDASGRLVVSANATIVPPSYVAVSQSEISNLSGSSDLVYIIPNTKELTISRFAGGSEGNSGRVSKISLFYDPTGAGTGMTIIRQMYLASSNWEFTLNYQAVGDGTKAIRMRRERLDGGSDEVAGFWDGFRTP